MAQHYLGVINRLHTAHCTLRTLSHTRATCAHATNRVFQRRPRALSSLGHATRLHERSKGKYDRRSEMPLLPLGLDCFLVANNLGQF